MVAGSAVDLVVSLGPSTVSVPNVVGQPQASAENAITGAGLAVGTVTTQNSDTVPADDVISQSPTAGTSVVAGSAVDLVVSDGPASAVAPAVPTERFLSFGEELDGIGDYVAINDNSALDLTNGEFTISSWINPTGWGQNNQGRIVDHGGGSSGKAGWSLHLENKSSLGSPEALRIQNNASSQFISDPNVITLNAWQHVAVTFDLGTLTFYVNGLQQGVRFGVPTPVQRAGPIHIGKRSTDNLRFFDGGIDELRIWNRALSQPEIQTNMNVELAGTEPGLIAYYKFNEGAGQTASDSSGNGHGGTLGSTTGSDSSDPFWVGSPSKTEFP